MKRPPNHSEAEAPSRRNRVRPIAEDARAEAASPFSRAGFRDPTLLLRWEEIAGAETARMARPIRFSEGAEGGVLTLKAEPGAALFLQHESRTLIERINTYLGAETVTRLRFIQAPLVRRPPPPPKATRSTTAPPPSDPAYDFRGPESVRSALLKLAAARQRPPRKA
jgi:hypothetical protein